MHGIPESRPCDPDAIAASYLAGRFSRREEPKIISELLLHQQLANSRCCCISTKVGCFLQNSLIIS